MADCSALTHILHRMEGGDHSAVRELFPLVYEDLRRKADYCLASERPNHTLQATALVNEVYMKMAGGQNVQWQSRQHFYNAAADAMRKILVDHARRRNALKRGQNRARVDLDLIDVVEVGNDVDFERLDVALRKLEAVDSRRHQVVMLRYFSGLTEQQVAEVLHVAVKTVQRDWKIARMFLLAEMNDSPDTRSR